MELQAIIRVFRWLSVATVTRAISSCFSVRIASSSQWTNVVGVGTKDTHCSLTWIYCPDHAGVRGNKHKVSRAPEVVTLMMDTIDNERLTAEDTKTEKKNIFKDKTYLRMVRLSFDSSVVPARMDDVWRDDSYNQCVTGTIRISSLRYWLREMVQLWVSLECHDVSSQIQETTITSGMYVYIHLTWCLCQL